MKIPVLTKESCESLVTEIVENKGEQVYQRLLELSEFNPVLYNTIRYLAGLFPTKEMYDNAVLSMVAVLVLVEAELERENLENAYFPGETE